MGVTRRRRWTGALVAGLLLTAVAACEVPDPQPGETLPTSYALPPCGQPVQPPCLPAATRLNHSYDGGGVPARTYDLYLPTDGSAGPHPLIIYVHGGGWVFGDKSEVRCSPSLAPAGRVCVPASELERGYAVAAINYRLHDLTTGANRFLDLLADVRLAVAHLKQDAASLGLDPARFVLVGASAGGQLASIAALTADGDPATSVAGFVNLVGPGEMAAHVEWLDRHDEPVAPTQQQMADIFRSYVGCAPGADPRDDPACNLLMIQASPLLHALQATPSDPPGYFVCGTVDQYMPCTADDVPAGEAPYRGLAATYDALLAARGGQGDDAFLDRHSSPNVPANPHNPTFDLNLAGLRLFLDAVAPVG